MINCQNLPSTISSKFFGLALVSIFLFGACGNQDGVKTASVDSSKAISTVMVSDSVGISDALRGFFTWYDANNERMGKINFVNETGDHLKIDEKQMQLFQAALKESGFVSDELLGNETKYFQACAKAWQNQRNDEVPTGLEADRFKCAQDFIAPYNTGTVQSVINGDRAQATLTLHGDGTTGSADFKFDMKKEGGKWLLARLGCDMGVKY